MLLSLEELKEITEEWEEEHLNRMERFNEGLEDYRDNLHETLWGPEDVGD